MRKAYDEEPDARRIVDVAKGLEGIVRNSSIHAAAVVIADRPLTDIVPLQLADAGTDAEGNKVYRTVTQFSMKPSTKCSTTASMAGTAVKRACSMPSTSGSRC